jgi:transposase
LLASARWHTRGREILYCAPNPATSVLKILVQAQVREHASLSWHRFIKLDIPDEISCDSVDESQLPTDWSRRVSVTRAWGDRWLRERHAAVLTVRSALVPDGYNLIINPRHAGATRIKLFAGSLRAGQRAAAVMSLIQSAKLNGHDPYRYLKDVLERLPTQSARRLEELLPHNSKMTS